MISLSSPPLQVYKQTVYNIVAEFIPLTMNATILQPSAKARQAPTFNKEVYVDFVAVQIKFLSFLAYSSKIFLDHSSKIFLDQVRVVAKVDPLDVM